MNKREFLKTAACFLTSPAWGQAIPTNSSGKPRTNWAGNYTFKAAEDDHPATVAEVQKLVSTSPHAKAVGARHSFNSIADSPGNQIFLDALQTMALDKQNSTVTVGAGVRYGQLAPWLDMQGFAVHNLASLPHVTVAGACATGTHGSGIHNGNLSTAVVAFEFIDGSGQTRKLSLAVDPEEFKGAVVAMGALGVITSITLKVVPKFQISQVVYENLAFSELEHNLDAIFGSGYSVSIFTKWENHMAPQVWLKQLPSSAASPQKLPPDFYGATLQTRKLHPLRDHPAENCTEQQGIVGPWYERLPHFKMNFTPSSGAELQTEYFVPRKDAYHAIRAVEPLGSKIAPHLFMSELRTIAADDLWMSMAYERDSVGIHFTWKPEWPAVKTLLPQIEERLAPFKARPHWAKLHTVPAHKLRELYPKYGDFQKLMAKYDPSGKFRNEYLQSVFG